MSCPFIGVCTVCGVPIGWGEVVRSNNANNGWRHKTCAEEPVTHIEETLTAIHQYWSLHPTLSLGVILGELYDETLTTITDQQIVKDMQLLMGVPN